MNQKWAALYDWRQCPGYASGTVGDTGYEDFVLNYTFSRYGLSAVMRLTVHMSTLQERMKGPRYDVYGPWPHWSTPEGTGSTTGVKRPAVDELGGGGGGTRQRTGPMTPMMTTKEMEVAVEATLNNLFVGGNRDEVPFNELYATLIRTEPRVIQAGRKAVKEILMVMEAANKIMHREGRIHLI